MRKFFVGGGTLVGAKTRFFNHNDADDLDRVLQGIDARKIWNGKKESEVLSKAGAHWKKVQG